MRLPILIYCVLCAGCATTPTFEAYHRAAVTERARIAKPSATKGHASALQRLGYTSAEIKQAQQDVKQFADGYSSQVAAIAAYRVAGFDMKRYWKYRRSKHNLTGYYNRNFARKKSARVAGWVLTVVGVLGFIVSGSMLINQAVQTRRCERYNDDEIYECSGVLEGLGKILYGSIAGLTGVLGLVGGGLLIHHYRNPHRFLDNPLLDNADAATLRDFRRWRHLAEGKRPRTKLTLSPLFTRGGGGLSLRLQF